MSQDLAILASLAILSQNTEKVKIEVILQGATIIHVMY